LVKSELPKADLNLDPKIFSAAGMALVPCECRANISDLRAIQWHA
jgi:hypothetical protein